MSTRSLLHSPASPFRVMLLSSLLFLACLMLAPAARGQSTPTPEVLPASPLTMTPNDAESGTLLFRAIEENRYVQAPLQATNVEIDVSGLTARTKVTQRFYNPTDGWVEGVYVFPLPENSAVDVLKMQIGDRFIEGKIKEREEARRIYEEAKRDGKKASLLEQQRPNIFTNSVANIGPHEIVVVQIEYQQGLVLEEGEVKLRFPMVVAPRFIPPTTIQMVSLDNNGFTASDPVPDAEKITPPYIDPRSEPKDALHNPVHLTVSLKPGFELTGVESPFHPIKTKKKKGVYTIELKDQDTPANRDFELIWKAKADKAPSAALFVEHFQGEDYLYALVTPPGTTEAVTRKPREVIFVIDNSGSMSGPSIRQAKESLLLALDRLQTTDRFNVIRFDDSMDRVFNRPVVADSENINYAKRFVSKLQAEGGTMMLPALQAALIDEDPQDKAYLRQVIFLTDGAIGNEDQLFDEIGRNLGRSRLFTVGIGSAPNSFFMTRAARIGRGTFTYIGDLNQVSDRMDALFQKLETPVMTDLAVTFPDGTWTEAWPNPLPDLYQGEPIVLSARMPEAKGKIVLEGLYNGKRFALGLKLKDAAEGSGLAKIWARQKIASLEEARFDGMPYERVDAGVLKTALDYGLVSRLTSLVAVDVTPSRPDGEPLTSADVPLNLPQGWDFEKVFGPSGKPTATMRAALPGSMQQLASIQVTAKTVAAPPPAQGGLQLPQGATWKDLERAFGLLLLVLAALIIFPRPFRRISLGAK